jgi:D-alanyl-D-alanine carboxypeptidase (penicillin-binding protein 5/6)
MRLLSRLCLLFVFALAAPASAAVDAMETTAEHAILMDGATGQVLWAKDAYTPVPPASMSKLMTIELLFQRLKDHRVKLTDKFPVSEAAWRTGGSKGFVRVGDQLSVDDLIQRIIIVSGNDACVVVAEALGGTVENFVAMMNARAKQLGLEHSHFVNPNGLDQPPGQLMSANDLAKLARHLIYDYPAYYHYFSARSYTTTDEGKTITQPNRNMVLEKFPGADGLKTGHIEASGYGITVSAVRDGRRLILVVNGLRYPDLAHLGDKGQDWFAEQRRSEEAARLLGIAYREFRQYKLFSPTDTVGEAPVWGGSSDTVPLKVETPLNVTLTPDARAGMKVVLNYDGPVQAPIKQDQKIGTLSVTAPNSPAFTTPVYAAQAVGSAGFIGRIFLGVRAIFSRHSAA